MAKHLHIVISVDIIFSGEKNFMNSAALITKLSDEKTYSRNELKELFSDDSHTISDHTMNWLIYNLQKDEKIFRISRDSYSIKKPDQKRIYKPFYTEESSKMISDLENRFPEMNFTVFESILLNDFLNHLIAQNTIYLFIDKDISSFAFDEIRSESDKPVLYNPSYDEFQRYWKRNCIVVLDLISRSPLNKDNRHDVVIEKMLVDIVAEKCIGAVFSRSELPDIYDIALRNFLVDKKKLISYAKRRSKADVIRQYMEVE